MFKTEAFATELHRIRLQGWLDPKVRFTPRYAFLLPGSPPCGNPKVRASSLWPPDVLTGIEVQMADLEEEENEEKEMLFAAAEPDPRARAENLQKVVEKAAKRIKKQGGDAQTTMIKMQVAAKPETLQPTPQTPHRCLELFPGGSRLTLQGELKRKPQALHL